MTDHPIIFSAPMIRALLDGRKTQTRRVLKPQPEFAHVGLLSRRLPYAPGDRLWVREAWNQSGLAWPLPQKGMGRLHYRADTDHGWRDHWGAWRSPIHMPRWASRLTLTVTDVRLQRLQEISEADAMAEGVEAIRGHDVRWAKLRPENLFAALWNSLHGPDAWDANPWVCAITFTAHRCNIEKAPRHD